MDDHCIRLFEEGRAQSIGSRCIRFGGIRSFGSGIRFRCCVLRGIADGFRLCGGIGAFVSVSALCPQETSVPSRRPAVRTKVRNFFMGFCYPFVWNIYILRQMREYINWE